MLARFSGRSAATSTARKAARVDAELGSNRRAVAHRRIVGDAVRDHTDRVAAVAVAHQVFSLTRGHGDDGAHPRPHRAEQELLVRAERSHSERVGAQVLGDDVGGPLPPGKDAADQVRTHAAGHDGG